MTFSTLPDQRSASAPGALAVTDSRQSLTNAELHRRVNSVAAQLTEHGVASGDVVALRLINRVEFVVLLFAAWRIGATITPVNPALTTTEVTRQLADCSARILVTEDGADTVPGFSSLAVSDLRYDLVAEHEPVDDPDALALLIYTSGTTGVPKGVMLDHANLDAMTGMGCGALQLGSTDRCLLLLPLFHVNGIIVSVLCPLLVGASVTIAARFDPRTFFDTVEQVRPTYFSAVPTIYSMLAALPEELSPDASSIRFAVCGAAPAPAELLSRFERRYGFPIIEAYGLSEGTCGSTINPIAGPRKAGTVGVPFPGQELRVIGSDDHELPRGVNGEIVVRGPNVMRGYLGRPAETAATIVDGWLHTGDIGHLDADGYLTIVGRSKEMIIRGGENIYPKEIEDVLTSAPDVLEAAVVGVPDAKWGEIVIAYVQPRPGTIIDPEALEAHCKDNLSSYKRPKRIYSMETLPKNAVGKLDKVTLRTIALRAAV